MNSNDIESNSNGIIFNASKNEMFKVTENMRTLHRKLKNDWKLSVNKEEISDHALRGAKVFVLGGPRQKFSEPEINCIKSFLHNGNSVIVLLGEGGENDFDTNINYFLEEFGIMINNDCVVRTHYYKYYHPKEAHISNGVANRVITQQVQHLNKNKNVTAGTELGHHKTIDDKVYFVYPYGATLNVASPAVVLLTSGATSYPVQRPVSAYCKSPNNGKLLVLGSGYFLCDQYIDQEDNWTIWQTLLTLITTNDITLNLTDIKEPDVTDYYFAGDLTFLAEKPRLCLLDSYDTELPTDFKKLFDMDLYSINTNLVPDVVRAYEKLGVKYEELSIITPQFEIPLPAQELAVFPPSFSELSQPPLELFDLDESFSSERSRLAQLTNKCLASSDANSATKVVSETLLDNYEKEMEYFVRECGRILKVCSEDSDMSGKDILNVIGLKIAHYKKLGPKEL